MIQKLEHLTSIYQAKDLQRQAIVLDQVKNTNESIYYNVDEIHRAISQNRQISFLVYRMDSVQGETSEERRSSLSDQSMADDMAGW